MTASERLAGALCDTEVVRRINADHTTDSVAEATLAADPQLAAALGLGLAWAEAVEALPDGFELLVGHTTAMDCSVCSGWWATASKRVSKEEGWLRIKSSEDGRPRGKHHDDTPAAALRALATRLRESR